MARYTQGQHGCLFLLLSGRHIAEAKHREDPMNISDCRKMQLWCLQRAKNDPAQSWKWLGEAERWRALGRSQSQQTQQAGPMSMGPYTINGDVRNKQQA
jgi:hypothetical protein